MTRVRIEVDGQVHEAEVEKRSDGTMRITVDGEPFQVQGVEASGADSRAIAVTMEGRTYQVARTDLEHVLVDGTPSTYRIDHVERSGAGAEVGAAGLAIRPPMPGRIVRLGVAIGDLVHAGDIIAVLEAMKMQNEVTSPGTGVVRRIHVQEGDTVDGRQPILELGPREEESVTKELTA
jgi:glutaconyl-CoA/methylmalonyl-CoA decarboxylase subunit gamma